MFLADGEHDSREEEEGLNDINFDILIIVERYIADKEDLAMQIVIKRYYGIPFYSEAMLDVISDKVMQPSSLLYIQHQ